MKRNFQQSSQDDDEQSKKIKTNDTGKTLFDSIRDELSVVLQYLHVGSVLMFAMTSKANYDWIERYVKNYLCKYYIQQEWSITKAMRLHVEHSNIEQCLDILNEIAERNGSICELSKSLVVNLDFQSLFDMLDIRKGSDENPEQQLQVETVCINLPDDHTFTGKETIENNSERNMRTIEGEPVGYDLKEILLDMTLTRAKLYKLLTKMKNLESLHLQIEQEYYRPKNGKGRGRGSLHSSSHDDTIDEDDAFDGKCAYVPIMYNLKVLTIEKGFENDNFIFELLSICPNLERLIFICSEHADDTLLEHLCKTCPKLKHLTVKSYDGSTQFELEITDKGLYEFLEKQKHIESVDLEPTSYISGEIFKELGNFSNLKHFRTQRVWYEGSCADQEADLFFGGNTNPNLEFIDIGPSYELDDQQFDKLLTSLKNFAPNLKDWGHLGEKKYETYKTVVELYSNSLESLELDSDTLSLLPRCTKLKKVIMNSSSKLSTNVASNPNVTKLILGRNNDLSILPQLLPNLRFVEIDDISFIDFLIENSDVWTQLVHLLTTTTIDSNKCETLISQRPNLFIEFGEYCKNSIPTYSPQVFYYQWLELDCKEKIFP